MSNDKTQAEIEEVKAAHRAYILAVTAQVVKIILETLEEAGPHGMPAGYLYTAMMTTGMSLTTFETMMAAIVGTGKVRKSGHVYYTTTQGA